jgi:hypothetical protein
VRRIFGPKREAMARRRITLHNEEPHKVVLFATYFLDIHIKGDERGGTYSTRRRDKKRINNCSQ